DFGSTSLRIASFLLTVHLTTNVQAQWVWQKPFPQGNSLYSVSFADKLHGAAVGEAGTILHTVDGGAHWIIQPSGTTVKLGGVSFTDNKNGAAAGYDEFTGAASVLRTTDGGSTWVATYSNPLALLTGLDFTDANNGTVIGVDLNTFEALILRTTD